MNVVSQVWSLAKAAASQGKQHVYRLLLFALSA